MKYQPRIRCLQETSSNPIVTIIPILKKVFKLTNAFITKKQHSFFCFLKMIQIYNQSYLLGIENDEILIISKIEFFLVKI